jgi:hypothetical protein
MNQGKPLLRRPWPYVAGIATLAVIAILVIVGARSANTIGCLVGQGTLGNRTTRLHNAFVGVYNRDIKVIDACQSVDCEKAPKLDIAAALKTYNAGLGKICWPDKYRVDLNALISANSAMAASYTSWATATTTEQDQSLESAARKQDTRESTADDILAHDLGVPSTTPAPS